MLARNPKTGAPIRILRSDASLSRTQKTLVWLQDQCSDIPWDRWETVCHGVSTTKAWQKEGKRIDFVILTGTDQADIDFFLTEGPSFKLVFLPKAFVFALGWQKFKELKRTNVIVLEEAHLMYPYLGDEWNKTPEDAVCIVGGMLRMRSLVGMPKEFQSSRLEHLKSLGMDLSSTDNQPMPLWYITQYYKPEKARRAREIKKCLEQNVECSAIDKLVLLNEADYSADFPKSDKIYQDIVGKRLTYAMVVKWIVDNVPDNVICVFGNADIYLDGDSWRDIWSVSLENVFMALLRWDVQEGEYPSKLFGPRNDSQDTWGFLSQSVKSKQWDYASLDFPFGKAGCDNAITVEMLRKKFLIVNPALSLKTHHLQLSNLRSYDPAAVVDKPCYMYVDPTGIHDMEPVYDMKQYECGTISYGSFERRLRSSKPKALDVYCKMLERGERYLWKSNGTNPFAGEKASLLKYTNSFQTPQGLVYGYNKIFVGKEEASKEAWAKSELSPIHPAYEAERSFAIPWNKEYEQSMESYVVHFLPKVLQLRKAYGNGEFFAPEKGSKEFLECFNWNEPQIPLLGYKPTVQVWSKEIYQISPGQMKEVSKEDVQILRESLRTPWLSEPSGTRWVAVVDGKYITTQMVRAWEETHSDKEWSVVYDGRTSPDRVLEKLSGASGLIYAGGPNSVSRWGMSWALPLNAKSIEIQNEMDPDGEAAHMSGAAGLSHSLVIVPRASEKATQEMISGEVSSLLKALSSEMAAASSKPTVYMPRKALTGFFSHAGDSFREMVELWSEKGFVEVVEDPKVVQIWLNGVGKTLLYDRPTMDWLFASPQEEQAWSLALFGNPVPSEMGGPAKSWFFWPRRPRLVEESVAKGLPETTWSDRSKTLVFYGKIENKVQEKRRTQQDWASACDDFQLVSGESTPYTLSQQEYLEKLSQAKFGLCLAGFGKKCHREVECMAMGCVPVCAPEVDMTNYANPPQEGIHYIRVGSPSEIQSKVFSLSEQQWKTMSQACKAWWKENCSAEGSWRLTQSLVS